MKTAPNPDEAITNLAGGIGNSMSLRQLHQWCEDRFGPHAVVKEPANRPFDVPWMVLDATRAWQRFGWRVQTPLASILEEIASHAAAKPAVAGLDGALMTDLNPEPKSELRLLSVVIPARDEEERIGFTDRHLYLELQLHLIPHDIVVVDDGSRDRTWQVLHAVQREIQELNAVQNQGPNGFGRPVIYGLDRMRGDAQVIMMADESDDIRDAVCYWQKMQEGYDCVLAAAL